MEGPRDFTLKREYITFALAGVILLALPILLLANRSPNRHQTYAAQRAVGDVNGDGKIDLQDVAIIREMIVEGKYSKQADLNGDGKVDEKDIEYFYDSLSLKH